MSRTIEHRISRLSGERANLKRWEWMRKAVSFGRWSRQDDIQRVEEELGRAVTMEHAARAIRGEAAAAETQRIQLAKSTGLISCESGGESSGRLVGGLHPVDTDTYPENWPELATEARRRDRGCVESSSECTGALQVHHRVPLSQGGSNDLSNLETLCEFHHSLKHPHMRRRG